MARPPLAAAALGGDKAGIKTAGEAIVEAVRMYDEALEASDAS